MDPISLEALALVLATALLLRFPLPPVAKRVVLVVGNAVFLFAWNPFAPLVFLAVALYGHAIATRAARGLSPAATFVACLPLLVPLFLPKLWQGAADDAGAVGNLGGVRLAAFIGASYFTLRSLHFVIDARRRRATHLGVLDALVWNSFFPTIVAGPIERADHFKGSLDRLGRPTAADLQSGIVRIFFGLLKKAVLAGILLQWAGPIRLFGDGESALRTWEAWRALYAIALYAYFDFSGYSDLAIGAARLMGVKLAENFDHPYLKPSISQFWRGWHISLSNWIRDYLFLPLCGRSPSPLRPHVAALVAMTLCGLWHAPNIGWALWGLAHGAGLSVHQAWTTALRKRFALKRKLDKSWAWRIVATLITFHFVVLTWVLVSIDAERVAPTWEYLKVLFGLR